LVTELTEGTPLLNQDGLVLEARCFVSGESGDLRTAQVRVQTTVPHSQLLGNTGPGALYDTDFNPGETYIAGRVGPPLVYARPDGHAVSVLMAAVETREDPRRCIFWGTAHSGD
jgi:hypothetical protein